MKSGRNGTTPLPLDVANFHHAYCVEGERDEAVMAISWWCERALGMATRGNPDFLRSEHDTFGIEGVRALKERAANAPASGGSSVFVIAAYAVTHEAQNALLKLLEDPTPRAHFFLVVPSRDILLPTVRSRLDCIVLPASGRRGAPQKGEVARRFVGAPYPARVALIEDIIERKDARAAAAFLDALACVLRDEVVFPRRPAAGSVLRRRAEMETFQDIDRCKRYLRGRAPSVKMIMEHIALVVPRRNG